MNHSLLKHYAQAYFSLGKEKGKVDILSQDMTFFSLVFKRNEGLVKFLSSPMITKESKDEILDKSIKGNVDILSYGFLQVLIKKKAIGSFDEIKKAFDHLYHQDKGILEARIYTPFHLSDETIKKLEEIFSGKYHQQVSFRQIIDKNVIAGMRIFVNDTLYDYSIDTKLNQIKRKLTIQN